MADKIALLDGNSLIYRAFHALSQNPLTSPQGELVNATYGFTMMLLRLLEDLKPTHIAVAFDTPKPTFRHERYDAYKGTRPPMPDGLKHQFARVYEMLDAFKIPIFRVDGLEADDLLGTMTDRSSEQGLDVVVVTGDTDALQLVGPRVKVMVPRRGITDVVLYDEAAVRERYALEPRQLVDLRALRGDVSDNIPGVPGIGDKTASKLLGTWGTIENLLANLDQLPVRQREQLAPYDEQIRLSQHLAQIVRDAPLDFAIPACARQPFDRDKALTLFHELGFRSLIERLPSITMPGEAPAPRAARSPAPGLFDALDGDGSAPESRAARATAGATASATASATAGATNERSTGSAAATDAHVIATLEELATLAQRLVGASDPISIVLVLNRPDAMRADILGVALAVGPAATPLIGPDDEDSPFPLADDKNGPLPFADDKNGPLPLAGGGLGRGFRSVYVPFAGAVDEAEDAQHRPLPLEPGLVTLKPFLEDSSTIKLSPHAKQATVTLAQHGITLRGVEFDSILAAYLVEASSRALTLQDLSWSRLNRELPGLKAVTGEGRGALALEAVPIDRMAVHACGEAETLIELQPILERELIEGGLDELYREVELPLIEVLATMERSGIKLDVPYLLTLSRELHERITAIEAATYEAVGHEFNINSPQQLAGVLFDELKLPGAKRTATGRASTAADVLIFLKGAHPVVELILENRELTKLKSTYVDALPLEVHPQTHRIHTTYNQTIAATGRLSSEKPNLQNIPVRTELGRRVRTAFVAPEPGWKLLSADYSQIELRIQAHLTQDPTLLEAFQEGQDVHVATASEMFGVPLDEVTSDQRRLAKTANFAIIYGISPFGFAEQTGLTQALAADFIRKYFEKFHEVDAFQKRFVKEARETGVVMTLLGRKRIIPELRSSIHAVRSAGERMAVNAPVQGTASDIIKIAMVRLFAFMEEAQLRARLLLQVHDELLFEVPDEELDTLKAAAKEIMEGAMTLSVPLVVDMRAADSWGAMY